MQAAPPFGEREPRFRHQPRDAADRRIIDATRQAARAGQARTTRRAGEQFGERRVEAHPRIMPQSRGGGDAPRRRLSFADARGCHCRTPGPERSGSATRVVLHAVGTATPTSRCTARTSVDRIELRPSLFDDLHRPFALGAGERLRRALPARAAAPARRREAAARLACEAQRMNVNDIIVQATVAVMLLALLAVAFAWAYRRWGRFRARKQIVRSFESVSAAVLRDVLIPDGSGGQLHIDFLLLTGRGLLVVDYRDVEGVVFGGEHMREWAVMNGSERSTFLNPLEALYDRIAAVKLLAGEVPVDGRIMFTSRSKFPKGRPPRVLRLDLLEGEYPPAVPGTTHPAERYRPAWDQLVGQVEPSPLGRA